MKKITSIVFILILLVLCTSIGCTRNCAMENMNFDVTKVSNNAVVHDPSIFYDEVTKKYYAFGSHFAVASSTDLVNWKQEVNEYFEPDKLYGTKDFRSVLVKSDEFTGREGGINSTWAPDVIKYENKYYMYYALTSAFGKGKSCIGRVSSDNVLGPYSNEEVLIYSHDLWWEEPNAIDPELFYDKNGRLWMVYGSYFAGIYVKELHNGGENFGLPIDEGFGKKIMWDGYSSGVEGPFIFYAKETDYYYLMVSEGNLASNYNMRISRSKNPDGPYCDVTGADVLTPNGKGNKLASNYRFQLETYGHCALGHNSVIKKDGEYFCIFHERYGYGDKIIQKYNIRVRKLIFNDEGWPMLSPTDYRGEKELNVNCENVYGTYDLIVHNRETVDDIVVSETYTFSRSGAILKEGVKKGYFNLKDNNVIKLKLNGVQYEGKLVVNYVDFLGKVTITITAVSNDGVPLYAILR